MSFNLNSRMLKAVAPGALAEAPARRSRRDCLQTLLVLPWLTLAGQAAAEAPWPGLQRWGEGAYRRYGFHIYDAVLWATEHPERAPRALQLTYGRRISREKIVAASLDEMAALGAAGERLPAWGQQLAALLPDVVAGDRLLGIHEPDGALFYFNGRRLGGVRDAEFARRFFGIWLDPQTSAPELRAALLRRPAS
jgi:hypothetical protein